MSLKDTLDDSTNCTVQVNINKGYFHNHISPRTALIIMKCGGGNQIEKRMNDELVVL